MIVLETVCVAFAMFSALPVPHVDWNERNMRYALAARADTVIEMFCGIPTVLKGDMPC